MLLFLWDVTRKKHHAGQCDVEMGTSLAPINPVSLTVKGRFAMSKGGIPAVANMPINQCFELIHQCQFTNFHEPCENLANLRLKPTFDSGRVFPLSGPALFSTRVTSAFRQDSL